MALKPEDYQAQQAALLPPGRAFSREKDGILMRLLLAFGAMFSRVDTRNDQLFKEADPRTTSEMLTDWESTTGLPDPYFIGSDSLSQTISERREDVVTKLTGSGGQSISYFISLAERLGYTITITEFRRFKAGSKAGSPLTNGPWIFYWQVNAPLETLRRFKAGSGAGEPLAKWGNERLERILRRYKPAHTEIIFSYT